MYFDVSMYLFQTLLSRVRIELCYSQDGWIFAKLFLHVKMESKSLSLSKRTRPIYSHLDQANLRSIKNLLYGIRGSPGQERQCHLACSGSQSQCQIWFVLPTHGASHNDGTIYCSTTGNFEEHINKGDQPWLIDFCVPEGGENLT